MYRCSNGVRGRGALVTYLSHTAAFRFNGKIRTSSRGIKHRAYDFDHSLTGPPLTGDSWGKADHIHKDPAPVRVRRDLANVFRSAHPRQNYAGPLAPIVDRHHPNQWREFGKLFAACRTLLAPTTIAFQLTSFSGGVRPQINPFPPTQLA